MTHCPIHNKPLVRTFRGSLICIPCYLKKCNDDRNGTGGKASATNERHARANRERSRRYMANKRAAAREGA